MPADRRDNEDATPAFRLDDSLLSIFEADSPENVYTWALELLRDRIDADEVKIAIAHDGLLVPTACANHGVTGREHGIAIATSIPGSVFVSGEGCIVEDLQQTRGAVARTQERVDASDRTIESHRSFVCAPIDDIGVIFGACRSPHAFDDGDLEVVETVGKVVSHAVKTVLNADNSDEDAGYRLLQDISSVVSHDLRNQLNIAMGHLDLANKSGESTHFEAVNDALQRIESISAMIVTLARSGEPVEELQSVELAHIAEERFTPLDSSETQLNIKASASILADPRCLAQILENVFRNAIEHSPSPVSVEIGLLADGFYVADDGPGIPEDIRASVFDIGFSTSEDHQGTGLSIVQLLSEAHGWDISIGDSMLGGTRVEVRDVVFR